MWKGSWPDSVSRDKDQLLHRLQTLHVSVDTSHNQLQTDTQHAHSVNGEEKSGKRKNATWKKIERQERARICDNEKKRQLILELGTGSDASVQVLAMQSHKKHFWINKLVWEWSISPSKIRKLQKSLGKY